MGDAVLDSNKKGWLVAILELGAWFGVLVTGPVADRISRKYTIISGMFFPDSPHIPGDVKRRVAGSPDCYFLFWDAD